jgi:putative flippase GtrA
MKALLIKYAKYGLVGLTGTVINFVVFTIALRELPHQATSDFIASVAAFGVAVISNFTWNNLWTFKTNGGHVHALHVKLSFYIFVSLGALAINEAALFLLSFIITPYIGQLTGILCGSVFGFLISRRYVFVEKEDV